MSSCVFMGGVLRLNRGLGTTRNCSKTFMTGRGMTCANEQRQKQIQSKQQEIMARGLPKRKPIPGVKQILIVASGKGGVGKSTTAVNLSVALKNIEPTKSVGLLDADVFGPSIPLMMNLSESPLLTKDRLIEPLVNYGVKCMSMGFLIQEKSSVMWRGLMVMNAINKLLYGVAWDPLDYLIIDTPPGTGDTHLSLMQNLPVSGVVLVTTPQRAAVEVTRRGATLFQKLDVPIVGIVENMSNVTCPNCQSEIKLFGRDTEEIAEELNAPILQRLPLSEEVSQKADLGVPIVLSVPNSVAAKMYTELAEQVATFLSQDKILKEQNSQPIK